MKPKDTAENKTRTIDPEVAELRAYMRAKLADIKAAKVSAKVRLKIEALLPKLTNDDKTVLLNAISK